jgi:DNA polymerase-1
VVRDLRDVLVEQQYYDYGEAKLMHLLAAYNQTATKTLRWGSSRPNMQNIKKTRGEGEPGLRHLFIPAPGCCLIDADWVNLELRIAAYASGDPAMVTAFNAGRDLHTESAKLMFDTDSPTKVQRSTAKSTNFLILYGGGGAKLAATIRAQSGAFVTPEQGDEWVEQHKRAFPRLHEWCRGIIRRVKQDGFVRTLYGYRLRVPRWDGVETKAVDYVVQGTASELAERALVAWHRYLRLRGPICEPARIWLFVHDEIVTEAPLSWLEEPGLGHVREKVRLMEANGLGFPTPVEVTVCCRNWAEKEPLSWRS